MNHECKTVRVYAADGVHATYTNKITKEANLIYDSGLLVSMANGVPYLLWIDRRSGHIHWSKDLHKVYEQSEYISAFTDLRDVEISVISQTECKIFLRVFPNSTSYMNVTSPQLVVAKLVPYGQASEDSDADREGGDVIEFTLKHKNASFMTMYAAEAICAMLSQANYNSIRRLNADPGFRVVTERQVQSVTPWQHRALQAVPASGIGRLATSAGTMLFNFAHNDGVDLENMEQEHSRILELLPNLPSDAELLKAGEADLNNVLHGADDAEQQFPILALGLMVKKQSGYDFLRKSRFMWVDVSTACLQWCKGLNKSERFKSVPLKLWVAEVETSYHSNYSSFRLIFRKEVVEANQKSPGGKKGRFIDVMIEGADSRSVVEMFSSYVSSIIFDDVGAVHKDEEYVYNM